MCTWGLATPGAGTLRGATPRQQCRSTPSSGLHVIETYGYPAKRVARTCILGFRIEKRNSNKRILYILYLIPPHLDALPSNRDFGLESKYFRKKFQTIVLKHHPLSISNRNFRVEKKVVFESSVRSTTDLLFFWWIRISNTKFSFSSTHIDSTSIRYVCH